MNSIPVRRLRARNGAPSSGFGLFHRWLHPLAALILGAFMLAPGGASAAESNLAFYVELTGVIDPASAGALVRQIHAAEGAGASALILRLDTPGAVGTEAERLVRAVLASPIPVVVWVGPGDARAQGVGALLAAAGHYSAMAPAATLGPARPLDLKEYGNERTTRTGTQRLDGLLEQIERSQRGLGQAELGELNDVVGAEDAKRLRIVDQVTGSIPDLLKALQGRSLAVKGQTATLLDQPFALRFMKMGLVERLVHGALRPAAAYLLLMVGLFGIIFELYNPGVGAAGLAGGVALAFSAYALTVLPTSWAAAALLMAGFALLMADLRTNRLGWLSALGAVAVLLGSLGLFAGVHPALALPWWAVVAGMAASAVFFLSIMTSAVRARAAKPLVGTEGLVGSLGVARTDISPEGQVMARGTLWRAQTTGAAIGRGTAIKILGVRGLVLMVEAAEEIRPGS